MKHMAHLQAEYSHKMKEMSNSIQAMQAEKDAALRTLQSKASSSSDAIVRAVQAQTKELDRRLSHLEGGRTHRSNAGSERNTPRDTDDRDETRPRRDSRASIASIDLSEAKGGAEKASRRGR